MIRTPLPTVALVQWTTFPTVYGGPDMFSFSFYTFILYSYITAKFMSYHLHHEKHQRENIENIYK